MFITVKYNITNLDSTSIKRNLYLKINGIHYKNMQKKVLEKN